MARSAWVIRRIRARCLEIDETLGLTLAYDVDEQHLRVDLSGKHRRSSHSVLGAGCEICCAEDALAWQSYGVR